MQTLRFGTAIAVLVIAPTGAFAENSLDVSAAAVASLAGEQILADNRLELGNYENTLIFAGDIATEAAGNVGLNMVAGDYNLQNNTIVLALIADATEGETHAGSLSLQSLVGQEFNGASAPLTDVRMRNTVSVDINATSALSGNVGLNAASGAFNIQKNAVAIAAVSGSTLAQSFADIRQDARQNISLHHNAHNDVTATIILDGVSGNVGVNLASGIGNVQSNTVTIARPF